MSWLARKINLSYDLFGQMMEARERQARWLADLVVAYTINIQSCEFGAMCPTHRPIVILGKAYKPDSGLTAGSPALLVANILKGWGVEFHQCDPLVDGYPIAIGLVGQPAVYLIATKHEVFAKIQFPEGSVVIDPFRYIQPQYGVKVIPVGVG